jgi:hypothetical protein
MRFRREASAEGHIAAEYLGPESRRTMKYPREVRWLSIRPSPHG